MGSRVPISNAVLRRRRRFFPAHSLIKWHPISVWKRRLVIGTYCYVIGIFRNSCRVAFFCLFFLCSSRNMAVERFFSHWFFFQTNFLKNIYFHQQMNFWKWGRERGRVDAFVFFCSFFSLIFFLERSMNAVEGIFWSFQLERRRRRRREGHGTWTTCGNFFFDLLVKSVATFEDPQLADPRSNENAGNFFKKCHFRLLGLN